MIKTPNHTSVRNTWKVFIQVIIDHKVCLNSMESFRSILEKISVNSPYVFDISKSKNVFYCFIPTNIYKRLLFKLSRLQSKDLSFAKKKSHISKYTRFSNRGNPISYFKHLRLFLNDNTRRWYQFRINMINDILASVLNMEESNIIICFLDWHNYCSKAFDNLKLYTITINDFRYN